MYEGAKFITSSCPQGLGGRTVRLCSSCTVLMSVRSWIMVVLCLVQLGNQSLVRVQNAALCTCLRAFRTSPVASLHVEAGELSLELRRQQLCLQFICELRSNPCNPAFNSVFGTGLRRLFKGRPNTIPTLGIRLNQLVVDSEIDLNSIAMNLTTYIPPWMLEFSYPCTCLETSRRSLPLFTNRTSTHFFLNMMFILAFSLMDQRVERL